MTGRASSARGGHRAPAAPLPCEGDPPGLDARSRLESERAALRAGGRTDLPDTPVTEVCEIRWGRSPDRVWWVRGEGWEAVTKTVELGGDGLDWDHGGREVAAYRTGVLPGLGPGIRAPTLYGIAEHADGTATLWMEAVRGRSGDHLTDADYGRTAAGVGLAQGTVTVRRRLPEGAWLNRGVLDEYVAAQPRGSPPLAHLREERRVVDALRALPTTVCHFDVHPRNVMVRGDDVVLVDWSSMGIGILGEDIASLVASAALDGFLAGPAEAAHLLGTASAAYGEGLRRAGLVVDDRRLRNAVEALVVLELRWVAGRRRHGSGPEARRARWLVPLLERWAARARADEVAGAVARQP